jgi:hypothetical protein
MSSALCFVRIQNEFGVEYYQEYCSLYTPLRPYQSNKTVIKLRTTALKP